MSERILRVVVDREACRGSGLCVAVAPELFDMADDGAAVALVDELKPGQVEAANQAVHSCPLRALTLVSE